MNKDDIKKAFDICYDTQQGCTDCPLFKLERHNGGGCKYNLFVSVIDLITEQEKEINNLKDDYAKLQELFAQYQIASDKEMIAHIKQAKIELLKELIDGYGQDYISHVGLEKYKVWRVLKEIIEELQND